MLQGNVMVFFNYLVEVKKRMEPGFSQRCVLCYDEGKFEIDLKNKNIHNTNDESWRKVTLAGS